MRSTYYPYRNDYSADEKAEWLIDRIGLHDVPTRHEMYRAMRSIYPGTGRAVRIKVIDEIQSFEWPNADVEDANEQAAYVQFNLANWLLKSDSECDLLRQLLANISAKYPNFQTRDHPDFTSYTSRP